MISSGKHSLPKKDPFITFIYLFWGILIFLLLAWFSISLKDTWRNAQGFEYEWVAQSLANGFGYSFDAQHRWLFPELNSSSDTGHYPTAWVEPGYPLIMAGAFNLFGERARLLLVLLQTSFWFITALVIAYLSAAIFNLWTGFLAGLLLVITPATRIAAQGYLGNVMLAGLLASVSALLILWSLEKVSSRRGMLLGLALGLATLVHGALFLFLPASVVLILLARDAPFRRRWRAVLALLITTLVVISPWIARNFVVFDRFVPLRNGYGFNTYIGNPPLVELYRPPFQACPVPADKALQVAGPWAAVQATRQIEIQRALYARAYQCVQGTSGASYALLDEAERDQQYLKGTINFILDQPVLWFEITIFKALLFLAGTPFRGIISLLASLGVLLGMHNRKSNVLSLLVFVYMVPYSIALPFFYRYRYPVEPLILVLASSTLIYVLMLVFRKSGLIPRPLLPQGGERE